MFNSFILVYLKEALKILSCILLGSKSNRKAKRGRREACNRHTVWIWTMQTKVSNFIPYQCCILLRCTCKSYTFELFDCWILVYASFFLLFILCPKMRLCWHVVFLTIRPCVRRYPRINACWLP